MFKLKETAFCVRREPYPTDYFLNKTILPLFPSFLRPNYLTALRLLGSPFVFYFFWQEKYIPGLILFLLLALTDALDGALARIRQQITPLGIIFDPLADKILIVGSLLILVYQLHPFLVWAILGIELFTVGAGLYFKSQGKLCTANIWGKTKMILQVLALGLFLIGKIWQISLFLSFAFWLFVLSLILALISLLARGL